MLTPGSGKTWLTLTTQTLFSQHTLPAAAIHPQSLFYLLPFHSLTLSINIVEIVQLFQQEHKGSVCTVLWLIFRTAAQQCLPLSCSHTHTHAHTSTNTRAHKPNLIEVSLNSIVYIILSLPHYIRHSHKLKFVHSRHWTRRFCRFYEVSATLA